MKQPILYSFVRFRPYFETGEFVNVGLLMCEPQRQKLTYRLVSKNNKRVNAFFYHSKIFTGIRDTIEQELDYIVNQSFHFTPQEMARFFHHYVDVKDGIVQYSQAAIGWVEDPHAHFETLYTQFIQQAGVKPENQEQKMVRQYKDWFKTEGSPILQAYKAESVHGELAKFSLPLAIKSDHTVLRGIKPLAFDQQETSSMIEHCDVWVAKIQRAESEGLIQKENILFSLDTPDTAQKANILNAIKQTFRETKIAYTDWKDKTAILDFAKAV